MSEDTDIVRVADIPDEWAEDIHWKETHRIGVAEYSAKTREIKLYVYPNPSSYNIDLDKGEKLMDWLRHLNDKTWATSEVLGDLVKCWFRVDEDSAVKR